MVDVTSWVGTRRDSLEEAVTDLEGRLSVETNVGSTLNSGIAEQPGGRKYQGWAVSEAGA